MLRSIHNVFFVVKLYLHRSLTNPHSNIHLVFDYVDTKPNFVFEHSTDENLHDDENTVIELVQIPGAR